MAFILTIDDGPSELAGEKLDYVNDHEIKAIWFCLGENLEKRRDIALEIIHSGHILANHSYTHPNFSAIDPQTATAEITRTEQLLDEIYAKAGVPRPAKLFRFPYGDQGDGETSKAISKKPHKEQLEGLLYNLHYREMSIETVQFYSAYRNTAGDIDWLWSYDVQEWAIGHKTGLQLSYDEVEQSLRRYLKQYDKSLTQVILIHDHKGTAEYFARLVDIMLAQGAIFELPKV